MLKTEKQYLKQLVQRELDRFNKEEALPHFNEPLPFLKATHEYKHFLENIIKKLQ